MATASILNFADAGLRFFLNEKERERERERERESVWEWIVQASVRALRYAILRGSSSSRQESPGFVNPRAFHASVTLRRQINCFHGADGAGAC